MRIILDKENVCRKMCREFKAWPTTRSDRFVTIALFPCGPAVF
jgi:hypothetical protein